MKFIDLFAGIGGFHLGLKRVNYFGSSQEERGKDLQEVKSDTKGDSRRSRQALGGYYSQTKQRGTSKEKNNEEENWQGFHKSGRYRIYSTKRQTKWDNFYRKDDRQFTCVYSNEYDKYANQIYKKHFGECDQRDIRTVDANEIPDHNLLCAGFPCQSFSIAGKRRGFDDTRGTLFFDIARILSKKRPRLCLLENVKGLLSHDQGRTFKTIISTLDDLRYDCQWQVLNSKNFGVPQNRERVFIVGHLRGTPRPKVFPVTGNSQENDAIDSSDRSQSQNQIANTLTVHYAKNQHGNQYVAEDGKERGVGKMIELTQNVSDAQRVYDPTGIAKTLKGLGGGMGAKTGLYDVSPTLHGFTHGTHKHFNEILPKRGLAIRRLTPKECERLQGFPDGWTEKGIDEKGKEVTISDTQRYKMCGNAVTVNVIEYLGRKILEII